MAEFSIIHELVYCFFVGMLISFGLFSLYGIFKTIKRNLK